MGFDFTIAIVPNNTSLEREMNYIKSALLYADKVTLISPLAYMFSRLTDKGNGLNERTVIKLIEQILPLAQLNDTNFYEESYPVIKEFSNMEKGYLTFPTKFDMVDSICKIKHNNRIIIRMSVNPEIIINQIEFGTSRLKNRIEAINKLQ